MFFSLAPGKQGSCTNGQIPREQISDGAINGILTYNVSYDRENGWY